MALSAAEKQRRNRKRRDQDPVKRRTYLAKKQQKYQNDVATGKRKRVSEMTKREKRKHRRIWRKEKQELRKRKINVLELQAMTPPASPDNSIPNNNNANNQINNSTRRRRQNMTKCYRDNNKLQNQLAIQKALSQKYLMKYRREKARNKKDMKDIDSPRGKVNKLLRHWSTSDCRKNSRSSDRQDQVKSKVKRSLLYHFALNKELKLRYSQANRKGKIGLAEIVKGKVMRKYKLIKQAYRVFDKTYRSNSKNILLERR